MSQQGTNLQRGSSWQEDRAQSRGYPIAYIPSTYLPYLINLLIALLTWRRQQG